MTSDNENYIRQRFHKSVRRRVIDATVDFFHLEAAGGILLVLASALALIVANSPLYGYYDYAFNGVDFRIGFSDAAGSDFEIRKSLLHWINDGMMAIFFLLVGLEIKREMTIGALSSRASATLPALAAIGGMIVPAVIYYLLNKDNPASLSGWAIPCATDIAFALGVLSLLGNRVPLTVKILLTAVAIIDDIGAILIIAAFYTEQLHVSALLFAVIPLIGLFLLNRYGIAHRVPYILLGLVLWLAVLKSGVHATMAGVITALFIPVRVADDDRSPALRLEHDLHPWVVFLILPLFGFANAGVPFDGMGLGSLLEPVPLGIILGLFFGKQLGIFGAIWLAVKAGLSPKPDGVSWYQLYGLSMLCGIGFTMSLFIGGLAFTSTDMQASVRLGVLVGSLLSALAAYVFLKATSEKQTDPK